VLFLHMFWKGLKYHQLQVNKDAVSDDVVLICSNDYSSAFVVYDYISVVQLSKYA